MTITVLCSDRAHPVWPMLEGWARDMRANGHDTVVRSDRSDLTGGDILFLVSCSHVIRPLERARYRAALVLHASDLPRGRGWSPHVWAVLRGAREIPVCLLEAADPVDTGDVWLRASFRLDGHELLPEIHAKLFACEIELMTSAVRDFGSIVPEPQKGEPGAYLRKRTPEDSRLDSRATLQEQFDLLRVVDNDRYPAFFDYRGHRYLLRIEKARS